MEFMHGWNHTGVPVSIALPYIYFTQGFLTGTLQKHARKHVRRLAPLSPTSMPRSTWICQAIPRQSLGNP